MKIIDGDGKKFSLIAIEIENKFLEWLEISRLEENQVIYQVNKNNFQIEIISGVGYEVVQLQNDNFIIGEPFIWNKYIGIEYENYYGELALILYHLCSKLSNKNSISKIKDFVKERRYENE